MKRLIRSNTLLQDVCFVSWFYGYSLYDVLSMRYELFMLLLAWAEWWMSRGRRGGRI